MKQPARFGAAKLAALLFAMSLLTSWLVNGPLRLSATQNPLGLATTGVFNGLTEQNAINNALDALLTCNSGSAAPTNALGGAPEEGQCWLDTTSSTLKIKKRYSGAGWVVEGIIDVTNGIWIPAAGGGTGTVASATPDLCTSPQQLQTVSGTTTIASFGSSCVVGTRRTLIFSGAVPITYNSSSMILPGQVSYTTAANDVIEAIYLGSGNWRVTAINRINGQAVVNPSVEVGTVAYYMGATAPTKYVFGFGQAIARSSFPDYLAAVTRVQNVTATANNNTLTGVPDTSEIGGGMPIEGTCIPAGITISAITGSTITMSANATTNGTCTVTIFFTGYGASGSASTIGVPDCRGRVLAGRDDMGGAAANRLTGGGSGVFGVSLNYGGGGETVTLSLAQLPTGITSGATVTVNTASNLYFPLALGGGGGAQTVVSTSGSLEVPENAAAGWTYQNSMSGTVAATSNNTGGGAHRTVQPTLVANCIIRVLAMIDLPGNDNAPLAHGREPFAIARRLA